MEYLIGIGLAAAIALMAKVIGLDRERGFFPVMLVVVASYYDLFAVMGGAMQALVTESAVMLVFLAAMVVGFKRNLWFVVAGLAGHGVFDLVHGHLIANPGVPDWWPMFCLAYDVAAAAWLAALLLRSGLAAAPAGRPGVLTSAGI